MSDVSIQYQPYLDKDYFVENVEFEIINNQVIFLLDRKQSYKLNKIYQNLVLMGQSVQSVINKIRCNKQIEEQEESEEEIILVYNIGNSKRKEQRIEQSIINQVLNVSEILCTMNKMRKLVEQKKINFQNQEQQVYWQQINTIQKIYKDLYEELVVKKYVILKQVINNQISDNTIKLLQRMFGTGEYEAIELGKKIQNFNMCGIEQLIIRDKEKDDKLFNFKQKQN